MAPVYPANLIITEDNMKRRIGLLLPPGFQVLDLMATTVYELANTLLEETSYEVTMLSEHGGAMTSSSGISVLTEAVTRYDYDTLLVAGQMTPRRPSSRLLRSPP